MSDRAARDEQRAADYRQQLRNREIHAARIVRRLQAQDPTHLKALQENFEPLRNPPGQFPVEGTD